MAQGLLSAILRCWEWEPAGQWKRHLCFSALAGCTLAAVVYVGAVRTHTCGHDVMQFLDVAWRILNGQRPHVDFYSPMGPLCYLVTAAGLLLSGLRPEGVGYGAALFGALVGTWSYRLALSRMHLLPAALTGWYVVLLAAAPVPLGAGPDSLSHAMFYNRFGFALLVPVLLEVLQEPRKASRGEWLPGFSTGVAVALLFLLKASFFLVAVVMILAFAVLRRRSLIEWCGLAAGALLVLLPVLAWLHFDAALVADQLMTGAARGQRLSLRYVAMLAYRSIGDLVLMLLIAALVARSSAGRRLSEWTWLSAALAVFAAGVMLMATNAQDAGLPLSVALVLLMAGSARETQVASRVRAACALAAVLLLAAHASLDAASLAAAVRQRYSPPTGGHLFLPSHMSGLLLYDLDDPRHPLAYSNGPRYVDFINKGIRLLETSSTPSESVAILEQYNPFSYALLRKPGTGGFTFLAYRYSFDERNKPEVERLFGGTDIVMVPKRNLTDPVQYHAILAAYLPGIQGMYTLAAETPEWWMYRRRR